MPFNLKASMMTGIKNTDKAEIPKIAEYISAHSTDADCRSAFSSVGKLNTTLNVDCRKVLVQISPPDGTSRRVVPAPLRRHFPHLCHYFILAGHPSKSLIYVSMRMELYWLHITNHIYPTVRDCHSCAQNYTNDKRQLQLRLWFLERPLALIGLNVVGHLLKTMRGNQLRVVMTKRYPTLTKAT